MLTRREPCLFRTAGLTLVTAAALLLGSCAGEADPSSESTRPTEAEYRTAVEATIECIRAEGYEVLEPSYGPDQRSLQLSISTTGMSEAEHEQLDSVYDACATAHLDEISDVYLSGWELTGAEREEAMEKLVECLEKSGIHGLNPAETDSRVFISAIYADERTESESMSGISCFERYRDVWPVGDANNPAT